MKPLSENHLAIVDQQSYKIMKNASSHRKYTRDDLVCAGMEALVNACETYDPSMNIPFEPYAARMVHYAMLDETKHFKNYYYLDDEDFSENPNTNWDCENAERFDSLYHALDTLTDDEMHLVELRLGLNGNEKMKLRELSSIMHISNEAVNKRVKRIVGKLQKCA